MGHVISTYRDPKSMPDISKGPIFDPLQGFPNGRESRKSLVTEEEMLAAALSPKERDYCAHVLLAWKKCKREHSFAFWSCGHLRHEYLRCEQSDQLLRMKEYERERRLMKQQQQAA